MSQRRDLVSEMTFVCYEREKDEKKPAKYVVFSIKEGTNTTAKEFASTVGQIQKMGKEAVVAVIERRGEVIYYKASQGTLYRQYHQIIRAVKAIDKKSIEYIENACNNTT